MRKWNIDYAHAALSGEHFSTCLMSSAQGTEEKSHEKECVNSNEPNRNKLSESLDEEESIHRDVETKMSNTELTSIRDGLDGARNDKSILNLSKFPEFHNKLTSNLDWDLSATTKEIREDHLKMFKPKMIWNELDFASLKDKSQKSPTKKWRDWSRKW